MGTQRHLNSHITDSVNRISVNLIKVPHGLTVGLHMKFTDSHRQLDISLITLNHTISA